MTGKNKRRRSFFVHIILSLLRLVYSEERRQIIFFSHNPKNITFIKRKVHIGLMKGISGGQLDTDNKAVILVAHAALSYRTLAEWRTRHYDKLLQIHFTLLKIIIRMIV